MNLERNIEKLGKVGTLDVLRDIRSDIIKHKWLYIIFVPLALIVSIIYTQGLVNYYTCTVVLASERSGIKASKNFYNLTARLTYGDAERLSSKNILPDIYPFLVNTTDFAISLFPIKVRPEGAVKEMSYYDYLLYGQKQSVWSQATSAFFSLFSSGDESDSVGIQRGKVEPVDPFKLTELQSIAVFAINSLVACTVEEKTDKITIIVSDQDPYVAACMADSVKVRLQDFLTKFLTDKARSDVDYYKEMTSQAKSHYERACEEYAEFADANQDVILERTKQKQAQLENEMQLQFGNYERVAAQLIEAEQELQKAEPAFTTLQSATVPIENSSPQRTKKVLVFVSFVLFCITGYIFYKEDDIKYLLGVY